MASPPASPIAAAQPLLPDEILEDIFLRLDAVSDLARASAICRCFHRVATGHRFLRRYKALHPPPVLGFFDLRNNLGSRFHPADPPHQSAAAARAVLQAVDDFTFSFLPKTSSSWRVRDVRDGRFLLSRSSSVDTTFLELVVCDPLHRLYVEIPPIPGDLVPRMPSVGGGLKSEPFLAPADEEEKKAGNENSHFRVFYNWLSKYKIVSFVFSAVARKWCGVTSFSFVPYRLILEPRNLARHYVSSCFYWVSPGEKYMLVLDPREVKFSLVYLYGRSCGGRAIMDAGEGRLAMLTLDRGLDLYSKTWQNNAFGAEEEEWRHDNFIPLPEPQFYYHIIGAAEGYILLLATPHDLSPDKKRRYFAMNLKTLLVERLYLSDMETFCGHPYASFPPPFSPPSV